MRNTEHAAPLRAAGAVAAVAEPQPTESRTRAPGQPITVVPFAASRAESRVEGAPQAMAVVRGRCLSDDTHAPLAGCSAHLHGWEANQQRVDAHVVRHGAVVWNDPDVLVTAADGRFEFRFVPPPPYQFMLDLTAPGCTPMQGRWSELKPEQVLDVGDVVLPHGTTLEGHVTDAHGAPLAKVAVPLSAVDHASGMMAAKSFDEGTSLADGTFQTHALLSPGRYRVSVRPPYEIIAPDEFEIARGEAVHRLDVQVRAPGEIPSISGSVVDDAGKPLPRAALSRSPGGTSNWTVNGAHDGTFLFQRASADPVAAIAISASLEGYESATTPGKIAWGTKDVTLVLRRGLGVEVAVRDGDHDMPLLEYAVRCIPYPKVGVPHPSDSLKLRESGTHADGVVNLPGVARGTQCLIVEPLGTGFFASPPVTFEMTETGAARQEVVMWRQVKRQIWVHFADGSPVIGTEVELLRHSGTAVVDAQTQTVTSELFAFSAFNNAGRASAILVTSGKTGPDGKVELAGPTHESLVARALGPGHAVVVRDVTMDAGSGDIEIVVPKGATLIGHITPVELIAQLGVDPALELGATPRRGGVSLERRGDRDRFDYFPRLGQDVAIAADGAFRIEGIPAGKWDVQLHYWETTGPGIFIGGSFTIGRIDVAASDERREMYDLASMLKATLDATVTLDGSSTPTGCRARLEGTRTDFEGTEKRVDLQGVGMRDGAFTAMVWPGQYRLVLQYSRDNRWESVSDSETFRVEPGQKLTRRFDLRRTSLKLKLVGSDGKTPAVGALVQVAGAGTGSAVRGGRTDAAGAYELIGLPPGSFVVSVWPLRLATEEAQNDFRRTGAAKAADVVIRIGDVTVAPPETSVTLTLPATSGY